MKRATTRALTPLHHYHAPRLRPPILQQCRGPPHVARYPHQARNLHLAPPYLIDPPYTPRHQLVTSTAAARKRSAAYAHLRNCNLCPRLCGVNRYERAGTCLIGAETVKVNVIAPHFGEEPCIQGWNGSGSVFFSGCNLRCVFCQNHDIAHQRNGFDLTPSELADWFLKLQDVGRVHNINLITPEHVVPQVALAIMEASEKGLALPVIYNTSAFDSLASIELMDGLVDIYLPDFKVWEQSSSKRLLKADDYAAAARESVKAMHAQVGDLSFTPDGLAKSGVLLRHLVMPGKVDEGRKIVEWLAKEVSSDLVVHVMEQYHPDAHVGKEKRRTGKSKVDAAAEGLGGGDIVEPGDVVPEQKSQRDLKKEVRYQDINRHVTDAEMSSVRKAAETAGLWRFIDAAEHGGFNI